MRDGREQLVMSQQLLKCPYDPNHNIPKQTFFKHLANCKSTYKDLFVQCPFNPFHYPRKDIILFRQHCRHCPNRLKYQQLRQRQSQQYQLLLEDDSLGGVNLNTSNVNLIPLVNPTKFQVSSNSLKINPLSQSWFNGQEYQMLKKIQINQDDDSKDIYSEQIYHHPHHQLYKSQFDPRIRAATEKSNMNMLKLGSSQVYPNTSFSNKGYQQYNGINYPQSIHSISPPIYSPNYNYQIPQQNIYKSQVKPYSPYVSQVNSNLPYNRNLNNKFTSQSEDNQWNDHSMSYYTNGNQDTQSNKKEKKEKKDKKDKKEKKEKKEKSKKNDD